MINIIELFEVRSALEQFQSPRDSNTLLPHHQTSVKVQNRRVKKLQMHDKYEFYNEIEFIYIATMFHNK